MSYNLYILHADVAALAKQGQELSEIEQPELEDDDVEQIIIRLAELGYELESEDEDSQEYVKDSEGCPIHLNIYATEITLSVPDWDDADDAIEEACQDAADLIDTDTLTCYDPQTDEWFV